MKRFHLFALACIALLSSSSLIAQSNQYLHFDGIDDYAYTPAAAQYVAESEAVSMTGWFYTDALAYGQGYFGIRGGGDGDGEMYIIQLNEGVMECRYISSNGFHEVVGPAGTGVGATWQHIAWIYDGAEILLYADGVLVGTSSASGVIESMNRPFAIGKSIQSGFNFVFGGRIDEVTLWSKALSQTELEDMIANELVGDEEGLELYYKMNQGTPAGNNSSITELTSEVGGPDRNALLVNFAMMGETSNFNGVLEDGFQSINFLPVTDKLITDAPFELEATVNSGLPISFSVISGPATVDGTTVTLDGTSGEVVIRASQPGNDDFEPAEDVDINFDVVDPAEVFNAIDIRNPIEGDLQAVDLSPVPLASIVNVPYPDLFSVTDISYEVDGQSVDVTDYGNGHQTAWWTPSEYGEHTMTVSATHSGGTTNSESVTFNVVNTLNDVEIVAFDEVWVDADNFTVEAEGVLPSFMGSFEQIIGDLEIDCPPGGCDPWDRVSSIEIQAHDGEWYQIIRYLTPYGVACEHEIDLTDFASLLQGKHRFRVNLGTQGNGFLYTLNLSYFAGEPDHHYSRVTKLWNDTYPFGDMANLQPTELYNIDFAPGTENAKIKLVSTGHGWGENNSQNAAEFHHAYHHIWVDGVETFEQDNWNSCSPNPDACSPQFGTWQFDRAGWCPGSIAQFFDFSLEDYVSQDALDLHYRFYEFYVDLCHPNNPDCGSNTCPNCDDGFNPHLIVSSYLITNGDEPLEEPGILISVDEELAQNEIQVGVWPNPNLGRFDIDLSKFDEGGTILITDHLGRAVRHLPFSQGQERINIDLDDKSQGIYMVQVSSSKAVGTAKVIVE